MSPNLAIQLIVRHILWSGTEFRICLYYFLYSVKEIFLGGNLKKLIMYERISIGVYFYFPTLRKRLEDTKYQLMFAILNKAFEWNTALLKGKNNEDCRKRTKF